MNLITKRQVIGTQLYFVREGKVIAPAAPDPGGTVGKDYLPPIENNPPYANWDSLGGVKDCSITPKITSEEIMLPSPGAYQRDDEVVTSRALDLGFSLVDISTLFFETLMLGEPDAETGAYTVGSANGRVRGWLKAMQYDQGDVKRNVFSVYVSMAFKAAKLENKVLIGELEAKVLYSILATGTLTFTA